MPQTFARIKGAWLGRGRAKVVFTKAYDRLDPEDQITVLDQIAKHVRDERIAAQKRSKNKFAKEDANNAAMIRNVTRIVG